MARPIREFYKGGFSHILNRGVDKGEIFRNKEDYVFYLYRIKETLKKYPINIHGYNFLSNHIHYLIEQSLIEIPPNKFIASLHTSLGNYINRKYSRVGHLFQDRCKVKSIKEDKHLLAISFYINLNKVLEKLEHIDKTKASMDYLNMLLEEAERDPWSSYPIYLGLREDGITNTKFILSLISDDIGKAGEEYKKMAKEFIISGYFLKTRDIDWGQTRVRPGSDPGLTP